MDVTLCFSSCTKDGSGQHSSNQQLTHQVILAMSYGQHKGRPAVGSREETKMSEENGRKQVRYHNYHCNTSDTSDSWLPGRTIAAKLDIMTSVKMSDASKFAKILVLKYTKTYYSHQDS